MSMSDSTRAGASYLKSKSAFIALFLIFILNVAYDYHWVKADTTPPSWDQSNHLIRSLDYYYWLTQDSPVILGNKLSYVYFYPPLYPLSTAFFYMIFGTSPDSGIMVNSIYLAILLFSVYGIGNRMFDKKTGIIAALVVSLFPAVFNLQREFLIDFALISMVSLTIYCLIACDFFRNRNYSRLFGIAFALSMLTKWTAFLFIAGPLIYIVIRMFFNSNKFENKSKQRMNLIFSLILLFALSAIWYLPNFNTIYDMVLTRTQSIGAYENDPEIFTGQSLLYYFFANINYVSFIFFLVFIAGAIVLLKKRSSNTLTLFLIIAVPYLAFTLIRNKDLRYMAPAVSSISIIGATSISSIKNKKLFTAAIILISLFGIFQLFPHEFGLKSNNFETSYGTLYLIGPEARGPINQDWKIKDVTMDIFYDSKHNDRIAKKGSGYVGIIPDMPYVNGLTYEHYVYSNRLPFFAINCAYLDFNEFSLNIYNVDYIIVRNAKNEGSPNNKAADDMQNYFYDKKGDNFMLLKQYELPDNTTLFTYKNIIPIR